MTEHVFYKMSLDAFGGTQQLECALDNSACLIYSHSATQGIQKSQAGCQGSI
jgi:hypothetical protein